MNGTKAAAAALAFTMLTMPRAAPDPADLQQNSPRLDRRPVTVQNGVFCRDGTPVCFTAVALPWQVTPWGAQAAGENERKDSAGVRLTRDLLQASGCNAAALLGDTALGPTGTASGDTVRSFLDDLGAIPLVMIPPGILYVGFTDAVLQRIPGPFPGGDLGTSSFYAESLDPWLAWIDLIQRNGGNPLLCLLTPEFFPRIPREASAQFVEWLTARYQTIGNANAEWGSHFDSFADITGPAGDPAQWYGPWNDWLTYLILRFRREFDHVREDLRSPPGRKSTLLTAWPAGGPDAPALWRLPGIAREADAVACCAPALLSSDSAARRKSVLALYLAASRTRRADPPPLVDVALQTPLTAQGPRSDIESALWTEVAAGVSAMVVILMNGAVPALMEGFSGTPENAYLPAPIAVALRRFREQIDRTAPVVLGQNARNPIGGLVVHPMEFLPDAAGMITDPTQEADFLTALLRCGLDPVVFAGDLLRRQTDFKGIPLLVAPGLVRCPDALRSLLERYVRAGGVLIVGPDAFTRNLYNRPRNEEPFLGLRFKGEATSQEPSPVTLRLGARRKVANGRFAVVRQAVPSTAQAVGVLPDGVTPAIYRRRLGRGMVLTLLFKADCGSLTNLLNTIVHELDISRRAWLGGPTGETLPAAPLEIAHFGRGGRQVVLVVNPTETPVLAQLHIRTDERRPAYLTDVLLWEGVLSPSERRTWTPRELEKGLPVYVPPRAHRLFLASTTPPEAWTGERHWNAALARYARTPRTAEPEARSATKTPSGEEQAQNAPDPRFLVPIDLAEFVNATLTDDGPAALNARRATLHIPLRPGWQPLDGTPWLIPAAPNSGSGPACVAVGGPFPDETDEILLPRRLEAVWLLAAGIPQNSPSPQECGTVRFEYMDGTSTDLPLKLPQNVGPWNAKAKENVPKTNILRLGSGARTRFLYILRWRNPNPDKKALRNFKLIAASGSITFVAAVTGAVRDRVLPNGIDPTDAHVLLGTVLRPGWSVQARRNCDVNLETGTDGSQTLVITVRRSGTAEVRITPTRAEAPITLGKGGYVLEFEARTFAPEGTSASRSGSARATALDVALRARKTVRATFQLPPAAGLARADVPWRISVLPLSGPGPVRNLTFTFRRTTTGQRCELRNIWIYRPNTAAPQ